MRRNASQRLNGHVLTTCQPREEIPRLVPTCLLMGMHNVQLSILYLDCCVLICEYTASVLPTSCARRRDLLRRMRAARTTRSRHCIMTSTSQDNTFVAIVETRDFVLRDHKICRSELPTLLSGSHRHRFEVPQSPWRARHPPISNCAITTSHMPELHPDSTTTTPTRSMLPSSLSLRLSGNISWCNERRCRPHLSPTIWPTHSLTLTMAC